MFNMARIPQPGCDQFSNIDHKALHTTFIIDDFVYSIDVFSPAESSDDVARPLAVAEIELRIKAAVADVRGREKAGEQAEMVGLLTADERDAWTRVSPIDVIPGGLLTKDHRIENAFSSSPPRIGPLSTPSPGPSSQYPSIRTPFHQ